MVVNVYGISFWVSEIVDQIPGLSEVAAGFVTAVPYTVAIVGLVLISRHSDHTGERKLHVAIPLAIGAVSFTLSTMVSPVAAIAALAVGLFFLLGAHPVFWSMPAALLSGPAAAAGIALVNSIGNLGGFVGPYLVGVMKDATGSTDGGLVTLAAVLALGAVLATRAAHDPALERAPREGSGRFRRAESAAEPAQQPVT
jgi:MFS transporter, ACS family, tartrate transporter